MSSSDPFADRRLIVRATLALLLANMRYWTTVAPLVRTQLARWERRAQAIGDPFLRTLAISKLQRERFNVEVAATLATPAPRAQRADATEAIVALQVMYDYLDLLSEQPPGDPRSEDNRLFAALTDALCLEHEPGGDYYRDHPQSEDGGYLQALVTTARDALARLPAAAAVVEVAQLSAKRCAEAQMLSHAAACSPGAEVEAWAIREASATGLGWPEFLAGATASVLAVHALIAAAADRRTTGEVAEQIDAVYLSIGALTMLDSLVDHQDDIGTGALGYVQYYDSPELMAVRLLDVARAAARRARALPNAAHHIMTLVGVVAYYCSAPGADSAIALPVTEHMRRALRPLITPTLALMWAWRLTKRARPRRRSNPHQTAPQKARKCYNSGQGR
jgi:tetraprenyl-beta-curcumene synthase